MTLNRTRYVVIVGLLALGAIIFGVSTFTSEATAGDGTPAWDSELPIAQLQIDLEPDHASMTVWRTAAETCMDSAGFDYDASAVSFSARVDSNRYGITEAPMPGGDADRDSGAGRLDPEAREDFDRALIGDRQLSVALSDGSTLYLPIGGCVETADNAAFDDRVAYWKGVHETQIALGEALSRTEATPRIQELLVAWRLCMADAGFDVDSLEEAAGVSASDPGIIQAHNACDDQLDYTQTWVEEESRVQTELLETRTDLQQLDN